MLQAVTLRTVPGRGDPGHSCFYNKVALYNFVIHQSFAMAIHSLKVNYFSKAAYFINQNVKK